jgi:hypothetical protein
MKISQVREILQNFQSVSENLKKNRTKLPNTYTYIHLAENRKQFLKAVNFQSVLQFNSTFFTSFIYFKKQKQRNEQKIYFKLRV